MKLYKKNLESIFFLVLLLSSAEKITAAAGGAAAAAHNASEKHVSFATADPSQAPLRPTSTAGLVHTIRNITPNGRIHEKCALTPHWATIQTRASMYGRVVDLATKSECSPDIKLEDLQRMSPGELFMYARSMRELLLNRFSFLFVQAQINFSRSSRPEKRSNPARYAFREVILELIHIFPEATPKRPTDAFSDEEQNVIWNVLPGWLDEFLFKGQEQNPEVVFQAQRKIAGLLHPIIEKDVAKPEKPQHSKTKRIAALRPEGIIEAELSAHYVATGQAFLAKIPKEVPDVPPSADTLRSAIIGKGIALQRRLNFTQPAWERSLGAPLQLATFHPDAQRWEPMIDNTVICIDKSSRAYFKVNGEERRDEIWFLTNPVPSLTSSFFAFARKGDMPPAVGQPATNAFLWLNQDGDLFQVIDGKAEALAADIQPTPFFRGACFIAKLSNPDILIVGPRAEVERKYEELSAEEPSQQEERCQDTNAAKKIIQLTHQEGRVIEIEHRYEDNPFNEGVVFLAWENLAKKPRALKNVVKVKSDITPNYELGAGRNFWGFYNTGNTRPIPSYTLLISPKDDTQGVDFEIVIKEQVFQFYVCDIDAQKNIWLKPTLRQDGAPVAVARFLQGEHVPLPQPRAGLPPYTKSGRTSLPMPPSALKRGAAGDDSSAASAFTPPARRGTPHFVARPLRPTPAAARATTPPVTTRPPKRPLAPPSGTPSFKNPRGRDAREDADKSRAE